MVVVGHPEKCAQCTQCEPLLLALGNEQDHKFAAATGLDVDVQEIQAQTTAAA